MIAFRRGIACAVAAVVLGCAGAALAQEGKTVIGGKTQLAKPLQTAAQESAIAAQAAALNDARAAARRAESEAQRLKTANEQLTNENQSLGKRNALLAAQLSSLNTINRELKVAIDNDRGARERAEQETRNQRAANDELQKEKERAAAAASELQTKIDTASQTLGQAQGEVGRLTGALADQRKELAAATQRANDAESALARQRDESAAKETRIAELQDRTSGLAGALDASRRDRWRWAAAAAAAAALVSAACIRLWWPKSIQVVKPVSLSVSLGGWSLGKPQFASAASAPFQVHTQWLPVASQVRTAGTLARRLGVAAARSEAT